MYSPQEIQMMVEAGLPGAQVEVRDMTGGGDHFEVRIVAEAFEGKRQLDRQRMVYAAIGPAVGGPIHALSLQTLTPSEAKRK